MTQSKYSKHSGIISVNTVSYDEFFLTDFLFLNLWQTLVHYCIRNAAIKAEARCWPKIYKSQTHPPCASIVLYLCYFKERAHILLLIFIVIDVRCIYQRLILYPNTKLMPLSPYKVLESAVIFNILLEDQITFLGFKLQQLPHSCHILWLILKNTRYL